MGYDMRDMHNENARRDALMTFASMFDIDADDATRAKNAIANARAIDAGMNARRIADENARRRNDAS